MKQNKFISQKYCSIISQSAIISIIVVAVVRCTPLVSEAKPTVVSFATPQENIVTKTPSPADNIIIPSLPPLRGLLFYTDSFSIFTLDPNTGEVSTLIQDRYYFDDINIFDDTVYFLRSTDLPTPLPPPAPIAAGFGPFEIFKVNLNGSNLQQLTFGEKNVNNLKISPNGKFLSYSVDNKKPFELHLWDLQDDIDKIVVQNDTGISSLVWSPDSSKLVFFEANLSGNPATPNIYDLNMGNSASLSLNGTTLNSRVAWSPDQQNLALGMIVNNQAGVYLYNLFNKTTRQIVSTQECPDRFVWSPDGKFIVYEVPQPLDAGIGTNQLFMYELETGKTIEVQRDQLEGNFFSYNAVWISDSDYLAYFTKTKDQAIVNLYNVKTAQKFSRDVLGSYASSVYWISGQ